MSDARFPITIYHNPACSNSRKALAAIQAAGYAPRVVEYLKEGWSRPLLTDLLRRMGVTAHAVLREKGSMAADLGLLSPGATEQSIIDAMIEHPVLVNRPIVATPLGVKLCRPSDLVLTLLEPKP